MVLYASIQTRQTKENSSTRERGQMSADDCAREYSIEIVEVNIGPDESEYAGGYEKSVQKEIESSQKRYPRAI